MIDSFCFFLKIEIIDLILDDELATCKAISVELQVRLYITILKLNPNIQNISLTLLLKLIPMTKRQT